MKAFIVAGIVSGLLLCALALPALAADPVTMENEFIRVVVNNGPDEIGRFSIKTTGGDPSRPASKDQHLIFGANAPWTSYTTVLVDGEKYVFGGATQRRAGQGAKYGRQVATPARTANGISTTYQVSDIHVTQELSFARGTSTRMLDTVGITYRLTNTGSETRKVGLRLMLDTMCGSNDGAPIRAGGSDAVTHATLLNGKDVPDYWQAFDSLANPTVVSQGSLRGKELTVPSKVLFADWGSLADEPWEPALAPGQGFIRKNEADPDTASALFWGPEAVEPEQSITYTTYYGIGDVSIKPGQLALGLTAPAETTFEHERTESFTITGYMQNTGGYAGKNVTMSLVLPAGLTLLDGDLKHAYAEIKPDGTVQQSWRVRINGKQNGKQQIVLSVTSDNIEANKSARDILLDVPPSTVKFVPRIQSVPLETNGLPTLIPTQVNLLPAESFYGVRFTVKYDPNIVVPLGKPFGAMRGRAFAENSKLLSWTYDDSAEGAITVTGKRLDAALLTQAEINLATITFRAVGNGKCILKVEKAVAIDKDGVEIPLATADGELTVTVPAQ
ncbi:MAG: cohesin domain-containing protein [Armatimonadota bacterium]